MMAALAEEVDAVAMEDSVTEVSADGEATTGVSVIAALAEEVKAVVVEDSVTEASTDGEATTGVSVIEASADEVLIAVIETSVTEASAVERALADDVATAGVDVSVTDEADEEAIASLELTEAISANRRMVSLPEVAASSSYGDTRLYSPSMKYLAWKVDIDCPVMAVPRHVSSRVDASIAQFMIA